MTVFGQLVIGPPGAGKTTYCNGMQQMMGELKRECALVNLDPANDALPYDCTIDVRELISVEDVMEEFGLGPNGSLVYAMEYIVENIDWLKKAFDEKCRGKYVIFDMPGQVELYTHNDALRTLTNILQKWDCRVCAVHLVDSVLCTDPHKYISAVLVSLAAMMQLELPHVNVLSKVDLLKDHHEELDFRLEHYTEVDNLRHLLQTFDQNHPKADQFRQFNGMLCELIEEYGLVNFVPCDIQDKETVLQVLIRCDQSNGRMFNSEGEDVNMFDVALSNNTQPMTEYLGRLQEEFCDRDVDLGDKANEDGGECNWCEAPKAGQCCSRCKQVRYCSRECQRLDWPRHKYECTPF